MITGQNVKNTYVGDGSTRQWNITFDFNDSSQIKFKVNGVDVATNFSLNTVTKVLTYPTVESELDPLTSSQEIEIYRDTSVTQNTEFNNGGLLNAKMIEDGLDKLTMIAQEIKDKLVVRNNLKVMPDGTDIDSLKQEGEYFIERATCSSGFPDDLPLVSDVANTPNYEGVAAYVKVIETKTESSYPTLQVTQICFFYPYKTFAPTYLVSNVIGVYERAFFAATGDWTAGWGTKNLTNIKRVVDCGVSVPGSEIVIPSNPYPNTVYMLGRIFNDYDFDVRPLTSLTLSNLPNSPYPVTFYFMTGDSFSGITASQIKGWIGSTTLDTNSVYKITITNLIGKIEKVTLVE